MYLNNLPGPLQAFYGALARNFFNPLLLLLFSIGLLVFVWGIVEFFWTFNQTDRKEEGKRHMFWGLVGMFVMAAAYALVRIIGGFFSVSL